MKQVLAAFVGNSVLANVALLGVVLVGLAATFSMVREDMPQLDLNHIEVSIALPGADPLEVEQSISRRIEAVIDGLEGVKQYHTNSYENGASAYIEVADGYTAEEVKNRVEEAINSISAFPADARPPHISVLKEEEEVIDLALWGPLPERQLKEWAELTRSELQRHPAISLVYVADTRGYEINVEVSKERLLEHGLTLADITQAIQHSSRDLSAGTIKSDGEEVRIRTLGRRDNGRDFASIVVKSSGNGELITLGQIAEVNDGFTDNPAYSTFNGQPCVLVAVYKAQGDDSLDISQAVRAYAAEKQESLPEGLHISPCFDESEFIRGQIDLLLRNGLAGLVLVLLILFLFLNARLSFWVAMGIPISLSGAMILLWVMGETINQISLVAFVIVLGIIVDDAIVVGEAIFYHRKQGKGPMQAAVDGVYEVGLPVIGAVTTTIVAFLPLAFVPGIMGQLMAIAPTVVIAALTVSLFECLFLLPAHLNHLPDPNAAAAAAHKHRWQRWRHAPSQALEWAALRVYSPIVRQAIQHRYAALSIAIGAILVTAGVLGGGIVRVDFWPPADGDYLAAYVEFPDGTPPEVTQQALAQTQEAFDRVAARTKTISGKPLVRNLHTRVFQATPNRGRILVEMISPSERGVHSQDISAAWEAEIGPIPGAVAQTFYESSIGMGGPPIEIWLQGKHIDDLRQAAKTLKTKLRAYDGVNQIRDDFRVGKNELQVQLKPEANALGLTLDDVARHLRGGYYGEEAVRFQRGREDVLVRVRYPQDERQTLADLEQDRIQTPQGFEVPLLSVADVRFAQGLASISGTDGLRRTVVWASVDANKTTPRAILADLEKDYLDTLVAGYATMTWSIRGAAESNEETLGGIQRGFLIALIGVFVIMAAIFRSYLQPFIILLVIPFGIVGVVFGHGVLGIPITFLSLFGIVALTGVVVNDAIVLIEYINRLLAQGLSFYESIARGGVRRFRAIFLTSASTCFGLLPLILEKDLQAQVVIPMAASIAFGLAFATVITLFCIPVFLVIANDTRRLTRRLLTGAWPRPEEVEPGTRREAAAQQAVLEPVRNFS